MIAYEGVLTKEELLHFQADFLELTVCAGTTITIDPIPPSKEVPMLMFNVILKPKNPAMIELLPNTLNHVSSYCQKEWPKKFRKSF